MYPLIKEMCLMANFQNLLNTIYIYLNIKNLSSYKILSTKVSFDIYNLLGTKFVEDFSIESSKTIKQDASIIISSNGVLRHGTTYDNYRVNLSFINRYELETLINDKKQIN